MNKKCRKRNRIVSKMWMCVNAASLIWFSLYPHGIRTVYAGKAIGICGTVFLLGLLLTGLTSGELLCLGITPEHGGKKHIFHLMRIFLAGLFLQLLYAGYGIYSGKGSLLKDSMVTAGIFCMTVLAAERKSRCVSDKSVLN